MLKSEGKPFYPYAVAKDSAMAVLVLVAIIFMSLILGAELGPKADPTTTTYVPRPEWYFFFLFELLRVIKPAVLVPLATIGIPTICMILLFLLPFYDRGPERRPERRPIATAAGIFTIARDGLPDLPRRRGRLAERDRAADAQERRRAGRSGEEQFNAGREVAAQSGCLACHKIGDNGNDGPGSAPDRHRRHGCRSRRSHGRSSTRRRRCPPSRICRRRSATRSSSSSRSYAESMTQHGPRARCPTRRSARCSTASPAFYDLMNSVMTAGLHHRWRARAADLADVRPGDRVLDVATGTGDLAIELAKRIAPGGEVIGSDFSEGMLDRAREKAPELRWEHGDALALPYGDGEFRAATVGFGARNFGDLEKGIGEMARVVAPGGKVVVLEITTPTKPPLSTFFSPVVRPRRSPSSARSPADSQAYSYLPSSVRRFPGPEGLGAVLAGAGLTDVRWILTAGGIIALHVGTVPST